MTKIRESNFDILRILAAFAVVMIHSSGAFLHVDEMNAITNCHFPLMLLNCMARFAVPCFFMLSGAFILADERNANYRYFYKKSFKNIGVTSIVFCMFYVLYTIAKLALLKKLVTDHEKTV